MKKLAIRLLIGLIVVIILGVLAVGLFLDSAIKHGVEKIGPMVTKTDIKLDSVSLSLLSGSGKVKGLVVGNPEGFKTPSAIQVGSASLALQPGSLLSDKVVIKSIVVQGPEITYETDLKSSNLKKLLANIDAATGGDKQTAQTKSDKPAKKLQVDDFVISGAKVHLSLTIMGGKSATFPLGDIHLSNLGQGPDGITAGDLTKRMIEAIEAKTAEESKTVVAGLAKGAVDLGKDAGKAAADAAGKVTKGIGDLFKKK